MEDVEIVELYWDRNQLAISVSNTKYGQMLKRISFGILSSHEDSEECMNDTYMKAWNTIPMQRPNSLGAYLGRIIRNTSINRWYENHAKKRSGTNVVLSELSECIPSTHSAEEEIEANELTSIITKWLYSVMICQEVKSTLPQPFMNLIQKRKTGMEKEPDLCYIWVEIFSALVAVLAERWEFLY